MGTLWGTLGFNKNTPSNAIAGRVLANVESSSQPPRIAESRIGVKPVNRRLDQHRVRPRIGVVNCNRRATSAVGFVTRLHLRRGAERAAYEENGVRSGIIYGGLEIRLSRSDPVPLRR